MERTGHSELRRRAAVAVAMTVALAGVSVCVAWGLGMPDLTRLQPDSSSVRFNTGLSFALGGTGLLLAMGRHPRRALVVLVPMLLLALLTLLEYPLGRSAGIDNLFIRGDTVEYPGRMAPNTAIGLSMAALGLIGLVAGHSRIWALSISAMLAALSVALGLVAAVGYGLDLTAAFEWAGLPRMALLTAIALVVLGFGILLATQEVGRIASWIEQPWLASAVGVGTAGLALLAAHALRAEVPGLSGRVMDSLDAAAVVSPPCSPAPSPRPATCGCFRCSWPPPADARRNSRRRSTISTRTRPAATIRSTPRRGSCASTAPSWIGSATRPTNWSGAGRCRNC